jgi:hypothetical protein
MSNAKFTQGNTFPNEMYANLNVFHLLLVHWVDGHVHGQDIVAEGHHSTIDRAMKLAQKLPKPYALGHSIGHRAVFRLRVRAGHRGLAFAGPRNQRLAEEDALAGRRPPSVEAAGPIGVGVDHKRVRRRST